VPKEVGKVGTESPTFIEPVATRKDGIQAMFSKQQEKSIPSSPAKSTGVHSKRKLEESTTPASSSSKSPSSTQSPSKKVKRATTGGPSQPESVSTTMSCQYFRGLNMNSSPSLVMLNLNQEIHRRYIFNIRASFRAPNFPLNKG